MPRNKEVRALLQLPNRSRARQNKIFKLPEAAIPHFGTLRPGELVSRIPQKIRGHRLVG